MKNRKNSNINADLKIHLIASIIFFWVVSGHMFIGVKLDGHTVNTFLTIKYRNLKNLYTLTLAIFKIKLCRPNHHQLALNSAHICQMGHYMNMKILIQIKWKLWIWQPFLFNTEKPLSKIKCLITLKWLHLFCSNLAGLCRIVFYKIWFLSCLYQGTDPEVINKNVKNHNVTETFW